MVAAVAYAHSWQPSVPLEGIVPLFQIGPEIEPWAGRMRRQVFLRHAEGEDVDWQMLLTAINRRGRQFVDFTRHLIGHGKAAHG